MTVKCLVAAVLLVAVAATPGAAADGFQTPFSNIFCILEPPFQPGDQSDMRCDVMQMQSRPLTRPPRDCEQSWGSAFAITENGRSGQLICHGDTARNPEMMVLPYGTEWRRGGFTCRSEPAGVTCRNASQHGFTVSRSSQRLF